MATYKTILLVDDDETVRRILAAELAADERFRVKECATLADAETTALSRDSRIDCIIADNDLPDGEGRDLVLRLRAKDVKIPILLLSRGRGSDDVVAGLDAGANDYILKPFRSAELLARLRAQLRGFETSEHVALRIGPYIFRPSAKLLQSPSGGVRIRLTEKETAVLKFLYRAEGQPVARLTLLHQVWGYNPSADSHTVETHIYRLRRKIEPDPGQIKILLNVGGGYRLNGDDWAGVSTANAATGEVARTTHLELCEAA